MSPANRDIRRARSALLTSMTVGSVLLLSACVGNPIPGLRASDCAAGDIVLTLSDPKITPRPGNQHVDSVTVKATCKGKPLAGAAIIVRWPSGSTSVGTTDSAGNVRISSSVFPTSGQEGTVTASANGSDNKSQTESTYIK